MAAERHATCIPEYAVTDPVAMPSTSNYNRDMAIGVDKSEFLKLVYGKEEDTRFKTLIGLKRPQVLERAGVASARALYSQHLRKSSSTSQLSTSRSRLLTARAGESVGRGHFLADTSASKGPKFPTLRAANDPAVLRAKAKARRRRKKAARLKALGAGPSKRYLAAAARDGSNASAMTGSSFGSFATTATALSNASNVSFRFGGKGRISSNTFIPTGFPSEKRHAREDLPEGYTEEMVASFSYKPNWSMQRTESYLEAVTGAEVDEEAKKEINLMQERREVLVRDMEELAAKIKDEELQLLEESKKKPAIEKHDPWAHDKEAEEENEMVIDETNYKRALVPPFLGLRYERGLKSHAKTVCEVPFAAPETSRIVAGRWRKRNENQMEAEFGFYSPPGETPFYLKGLGSHEVMHRKPGKRHLMTLLEQPHNNIYPLFSKK